MSVAHGPEANDAHEREPISGEHKHRASQQQFDEDASPTCKCAFALREENGILVCAHEWCGKPFVRRRKGAA